MKCFTVRRRSDNHVDLSNGISRPYQCDENGLYTWVGSPHHGPESTVKRLDIQPQLLTSEHAHDQRSSNRVVVWECGLIRDPDSRPRIVPRTSQERSTTALVLLTVYDAELICDNEHQVARGWSTEYCGVRIVAVCCERIFELSAGDSLVFTIREYPERVLGLAVHDGRETTRKLSYDGKKVTMELLNEQRLAHVRLFEAGKDFTSHLALVMTIIAVCCFVGLSGLISPTSGKVDAGLIGLACGVVASIVAIFVMWAGSWRRRPRFNNQR